MKASGAMADSGDEFPHVAARLLGKTWAELEAIEFAGYLLFPDMIRRRRSGGEFEEIKVMVRVPREPELRRARAWAYAALAKDKLDPVANKDLLDNAETMAILADAIRNKTEPHEPWVQDPAELEQTYDKVSLIAIFGQIEAYKTIINPRPEEVSEGTLLAVIGALSKERSIAPLHVLDGVAQASCIISMAVMLRDLLVFKSSWERSERSTAAT